MAIALRRRMKHRQHVCMAATGPTGHRRAWPRWATLQITRRGLQVILGVLWLIDGVLQLQPFMFSSAFSRDVLLAAGSGQPGWVSATVGVFAHQVAAHPIAWNAGFAVIQLALGVGLIVPKLVRPAIVASGLWAIVVWAMGEGFGGLLIGNASLVTGAPGAAALYAVLAVAAWPRAKSRHELESPQDAPGAAWISSAWLLIWLGGVGLQLLPSQNHPSDLSMEISGSGSGWLAPVGGAAAHAVDVGGVPLFVLFVALMAAVGIGGLRAGRWRAASAVTGIVVAFLFWMLGEGFGQLNSGHATDLNSGPLLIVFGLLLLNRSQRRGLANAHTRLFAPAPAALRRLCVWSRLTSAAGFASIAVVTILVTLGAAVGTATRPQSPTVMPDGMSMTTGMPQAAVSIVRKGPSASARMVCSSEITRDVAMIMGLHTLPATSTWVQHIYRCTYQLPRGVLVVSVDDAATRESARAYFATMRQGFTSTKPLVGLANLGLPAYETTSGVVVFLKDDKTLEVDASHVPEKVMQSRGTASDLAYTVATDILGCWTGG